VWGNIYPQAKPLNLTVVGAIPELVSVGGYLTGGVHSPISGLYGTGSDQVLEIEVVTASGDILTVDECQHTDLFWALRGVSLPPLTVFQFCSWIIVNTSQIARAVVRSLPLLPP